MSTDPLIDFHCHIDLYPDPPAVIAECDQQRICTLAVTTTPKAWPQNRQWTMRSHFVRPALGIHPQLVGERASEISVFEQHLPEARFIGEVGLDASPRYVSSLVLQEEVFIRVLQACAAHGGKVISIHSVRSAGRVLKLLERHLPPGRGKTVLHWFSGSTSEAKRAVALGCFFSINAQMFRTRGTEIVAVIPADRLLTETDGPFTAEGDAPARPIHVQSALTVLATSRQWSLELARRQLRSNLRDLVGEW
ncbi:MAG: Qat anti-phage system TatD family nuclease QatD [Phycisphaerales bacterium]